MGEAPAGEKRLLHVTEGNLRQSHLYVNGHYDFFPKDIVGPSKRNGQSCGGIEIVLDGLNEAIITDIGMDAKTGKPRGFLRCRSEVGRFYEHHRVKPGAVLVMERLSERSYRLSVDAHGSTSLSRMRAAEFFAGIGLVRLALEANGIQVVFANDIDPDKQEMYKANFDASHFHLGDIHKLTAKDVPDCELFTASFPCNDLSIAGAMNGLNSGQSSAFWGLIDILRDKGKRRRPEFVLLENVPGFLMSHGGKDFEQAIAALNDLGYAVDALILDAARFVPQSRPRLFVLAKLGAAEKLPLVLTESAIRPRALVGFIDGHPHLRWNIQSLPEPTVCRPSLKSILEDLPENDPAWWNQKRADYFMGQLSERHLATAKGMIAGSKVSYGTAFRRVRHGRSMAELRVDGIAGCLRTPRGGSARQILFKAGRGKYQVRLLTARECARLQGVSDDYVIDVPLNQALFGFGDAVCVHAVEWVVKNLLLKSAELPRCH